MDDRNRRISAPALDVAHIGAMDPSAIGIVLLAPAFRLAEQANILTEALTDIHLPTKSRCRLLIYRRSVTFELTSIPQQACLLSLIDDREISMLLTTLAWLALNVDQRATARAPQKTAVCVGLNRDLQHLSRSLAMNFAEGIGDDSAARATMREAQYNTLLSRVRLTMDLMRDNRCKLPAAVPTGREYVSSAIACRTDTIGGSSASSERCDQSKWVPEPR